MLLCVILVWPTEFENSLNLCKMCLKLENLRRIVWKSYFWETGFKISVFVIYFISYSCILFIKYYALKSFCTKLLCFSKKLVFTKFWSIKHVSWSIEIAIKSFGLALCVLTDRTYFSISWKSYREFFKNLCSLHVHHYSNFFKTRSLSIRSVQDARFFLFSSKIFARFFSSKTGKTFYPSFCIYFHVSCIKSCILGKISNQWIFGIFVDSSCFS